MKVLKFVLIIVFLSSFAHSDESVLEIVANVKNFRAGVINLIESAAAQAEGAGDTEKAQAYRNFSNNWLSIFGINTGITGLVREFVFNYLGRSSYHDINGPFINSLERVSSTLANSDADLDDLKNVFKNLYKQAKTLFADGSILNCFKDLKALTNDDFLELVIEARANDDLSNLLLYFAGGQNTVTDDDDDEKPEL